MNIYECIIPQKHISRGDRWPLAETAAGTASCGARITDCAIASVPLQNSTKIARNVATPSTTLPSGGLNTIHFAHDVMHKRLRLRTPRVFDEKFPHGAIRPPEFYKFRAELHPVQRQTLADGTP
jgi:hypothetical protein